MISKTLIRNATVVNEGNTYNADVLIHNDRIEKITSLYEGIVREPVGDDVTIIDATGKWLIPGMIDDQVHFREPGLTHKAEIYTEAKAAVAGGITSYMEMPNTVPQAVTQELLEQKYQRAAECSLANYSFFFGATNDNLEEVLKTDPENVCGIKIFMGSSTGNMLVDNKEALEKIFSQCKMLIATHCEDEATIRANSAEYKEKYGENVPISKHPEIRSAEACYISSSYAVELAKKHNTRLHILHISTARETELFEAGPLENKRITAEACVHHLWFSDKDYDKLGTRIKWNPAVKSDEDRAGVRQALLDDRIDILATDHAPHTEEEKSQSYFKAPSGGPLVQHALVVLLEMHKQGIFPITMIVEKACHNPAKLFEIRDRGFIREGYKADLVLIDPNAEWYIDPETTLYKCGWSPFDSFTFHQRVTHTWVNGHLVYNWDEEDGMVFDESKLGERLSFSRS